jgi:hypothetical protein
VKPYNSPRQFAVIVEKASGARVVFASHLDDAAADLLVTKLQAIGCAARSELANVADVPGLERRRILRKRQPA